MNIYEAQEYETRVWRAIIDAWWAQFGASPVTIMELLSLRVVSSMWGHSQSDSNRRALAWALQKHVGDCYAGKAIQVASVGFGGPHSNTYQLKDWGKSCPFGNFGYARPVVAPIRESLEHRANSGWTGESEDILLCPVCGYSYTHINAVESIPTDKGHRVTIQMDCEMNHELQVVMHQHKGEVSLSVSDAKRTEIGHVSGSGKEPR